MRKMELLNQKKYLIEKELELKAHLLKIEARRNATQEVLDEINKKLRGEKCE